MLENLNLLGQWVVDNPVFAAAIAQILCSVIVRYTKTETSNKLTYVVLKGLELLALNQKPVRLKNGK